MGAHQKRKFLFLGLCGLALSFSCWAVAPGGLNGSGNGSSSISCAAKLLGPWPGQNALQELQAALPASFPFLFDDKLDPALAQKTLQKIFSEVQLIRPDLDSQQAQFDHFLSAAFIQIAKAQNFSSSQETTLHPLLGPLAYLGHYILGEKNIGLAQDFFKHARHAYLSSVFSYIAASVKQLSPRFPARAINLNQVINILLPAQGLSSNDPALGEFFKIFTQYARKAERLKFSRKNNSAAEGKTKVQRPQNLAQQIAEDEAEDEQVSLDGTDPLQQMGEVSLKLIHKQILRLVLSKITLPKMLFLALPHHAVLPALKFVHLALQGHQLQKKVLATNPLLQAIWNYLETQLDPESTPQEVDQHRQQIRQAFYRFIFTLTINDDDSSIGRSLAKLHPFLAQQYKLQLRHWALPGDDLKWQFTDQVKPLLNKLDQIMQENPQASGKQREVLGHILARINDFVPPQTKLSEMQDLSILRRLQNELSPYAYPLLSLAAPGALFKYDLQRYYDFWVKEGQTEINGHLNPEQSAAFQEFIHLLTDWFGPHQKVVERHFPRFMARFIQNWQTAVGEEKQARQDFLMMLAEYRPLNLYAFAHEVFSSYGLNFLAQDLAVNLPPVLPWPQLLYDGLAAFLQQVNPAELAPEDILQVENLFTQLFTAMGMTAEGAALLKPWAHAD